MPVNMNGDLLGGTLTDRSGTITTGGASQQLAAANPQRNYLLVQNPSTEVESLYVDFTADAAPGTAIELLPGGSLELTPVQWVSLEKVTVYAATTGHVFVAKEA